MTYEEKIRRLRTARNTLHRLEDRGILENNLSMEQITAIRIAEFALDELPHWIPCSESMPDNDIRILILAKNESVYIAKHRPFGHYVVSFEYWLDDTEVTHWMPLPEPPKDGDTP